jgi:glycosyltransferase involved in cell wall biosynthesis
LWLIERLASRHEVLVVALNQYERPCQYHLLGAKVVNLGRLPGPINELKLVPRLAQMRQAIQEGGFRPDIIHAFGAGNCGVLATLLGRWWRLPAIVSIWSGELVWLPQVAYGWQGSWRTRLPVWLALRLAAEVTAGSRYALAPLAGRGRWLPLGVDTTACPPPIPREDGPPWRLAHVAHINVVKDQVTLLHALRVVVDRLPDALLDWVGVDTLSGHLKAMSSALDLSDHIRFYGYQPPEALKPLYQSAHLFVQSSLHESQGVAVCEAAALGVPTAGTAVGLVAELAPAAATAVAPGDAPALAQAILTLLQNSEQRRRLAQAARQWATTYNADWTAAQFEQIYEYHRAS